MDNQIKEDDGLLTPEVGIWAEEKYNLVQTYAEIFTNSIKAKWDSLVYIDLFAGAGRAKLKETGKIVFSSSMRVLGITNKFSRYIFCDLDEGKLAALKQRSQTMYPSIDIKLVPGDVNNNSTKIIEQIPSPSKAHKVLSFCFADPFKLDNLAFRTIEILASARFMDFLILIPTDMDANRNETPYVAEGNNTVAKFIGKEDWREKWAVQSQKNTSFGLFILNEYSFHLKELGYKQQEAHETVLVRNYQKNAPLYRLALFSRSDLAKKLWKETKKYTNPQTSIFD